MHIATSSAHYGIAVHIVYYGINFAGHKEALFVDTKIIIMHWYDVFKMETYHPWLYQWIQSQNYV